MNKTKTTLYTLMFASTGLLVPQVSFAENASPWECKPSADYSSWVCLKDGKSPVEDVPTVAETPAVEPEEKRSSDVTVTPLAQPEPLRATPVVEAPVEPVTPKTVPIIQPEPATEQEPVVQQTTPVEPPPVPEQAPESEQPLDPVVAREQEAIEPPAAITEAEPEKAEEPTQEIAQPAAIDKTETPTDKQFEAIPERPQPEFVQQNKALPSCVAVAPSDNLTSAERRQLRESSATELEADEAIFEKDKSSTLSGNVTIKRADQSIQSDKIVINKETNQADAEGAVTYDDAQMQIRAEQAHLDFDTDENSFAEASFITKERYSRGTAGQIQTQDNGDRVRLDKVTYTSCPPGDNSWMLEAEQITIDDVSGRGEATDVKVEFFDVPIFYTPYMNFPIDDRRMTGLLTPRFGRSDDRGTEITAPIYWNIAPDMDATFYPRYMSKRGLQLGGEFRYLNETNDGQVNLEYLGDDDKYTGRGNNDRWAFRFEHDATVFNDWSLDADIRRVSDEQYFEDLGSSLTLSSQRNLESRLYLGHTADNWSASGLLQEYQTVDRTIVATDRPYERMPHLNFDTWSDTFGGGFVAALESEYTHFDRKNSTTGKRTDLYPSITYSHDKAGYYIRPKFGIRYTKYSLSNQGAIPSSQSRTVPIISVDSGLFYDRETDLLGKSMLQTLEPRMYYLRVPEKNQTNIPIFDTGLYDYNSSTLFSENRFSGLDRIGDTNQLSVGVTSRFLDNNSGAEKLAMTLGQIYYFSNRDVTLPGGTRDTDDSSPIIAEVRYRPYDRLVASALAHWDPETSKTERTIYRLKYQPADDKVLNLAYRYRKDFLKQTDVSFLWPLDDMGRWHAVGRWNHSLRHNKSLDTFAGIEYESCCWKTRVVARRWVNDINSDYDTGIFFELELKGLGSVGDNITSFLETGILGYDRHIKDEDDDTYYY